MNQKAPAVGAVDGEEGAAQVIQLDEIQCRRPVLDPLGEVGMKQDVDAVVDLLGAFHFDAERAPHLALRALGRDQVARLEFRFLASGAIGQCARDAVGGLAERCQLGVEAKFTGAGGFREAADHRLEVILRAQAILHRRHRHVLRQRAAGHEAMDLAARQRFRPDDQARAGLRQPRRTHRFLDAALPEHLHGAGIDAARLRRQRGAGMTLHHQRLDAVLRQQQRGHQADRAAAGNQNGDIEHISFPFFL